MPQFRARIVLGVFDPRDDVIDDRLLPGIQHALDKRVAIGEFAVEAALGHAQRRGQRLDPDGVRTSFGQCGESRIDPSLCRRLSCRHNTALYGGVLTFYGSRAYSLYVTV